MSNAKLLYAFGFVIPGNPNDRLEIPKQMLKQGQARISPELVVAAKRVCVEEERGGGIVGAQEGDCVFEGRVGVVMVWCILLGVCILLGIGASC